MTELEDKRRTIDTRLEQKIGFDRIRQIISDRCSTSYAAERTATETFSTNPSHIRRRLLLTDEMRLIMMFEDSFPSGGFIDCIDFLKPLERSSAAIDLLSLRKLKTMLETLRKVTSFFDGIKDGIAEKIQAAHDKIKEIVGKIKSLFDFDIEFPTPKLPHINYHMQDLGGFLSIPIFEGISWYANGGVFKHPTVIGVGDRGKEAAMPLNSNTYREIAAGISQQMGAVGGDVNVTVTGNTFVVREEADIDRIADALAVRNARERRYGSWAGQSSFTTA